MTKLTDHIRQIDAGELDIGYADLGPMAGRPVLLLHGWPYDIHTYAEVAPMLAQSGHRVIVPHARGFGTTRFRSSATPRNGQQAALAMDVLTLMDALAIDRAVLAGCDWGARAACCVAALRADRVEGLISAPPIVRGSPLTRCWRPGLCAPVHSRTMKAPHRTSTLGVLTAAGTGRGVSFIGGSSTRSREDLSFGRPNRSVPSSVASRRASGWATPRKASGSIATR